MTNEIEPWVALGVTEAEYWKDKFIKARQRNLELEKKMLELEEVMITTGKALGELGRALL